MSSNKWMADENVVHVHYGIFSGKEKWIMKFASKWVALEKVIVDEVNQTIKRKKRQTGMFSLICISHPQMWLHNTK